MSNEELRGNVNNIRRAYKGKGDTKLTQEMIDKLNAINRSFQRIQNKHHLMNTLL